MTLNLTTMEEQLAVVERVIELEKEWGRGKGDVAKTMRAVAADLRAKLEIPRSSALGDLERAMELMIRSKTALGYDQGRAENVARVVTHHWSFIRQALEAFGAESAE